MVRVFLGFFKASQKLKIGDRADWLNFVQGTKWLIFGTNWK